MSRVERTARGKDPVPPATSELVLRPFRPGDEAAFREVNEAWISAYFAIEAKDEEILGDPVNSIIKPGGAVLMAVLNLRAIGCCALLPMGEGAFELGKMAIAEGFRGRGYGRQLLAYAIEYARGLKARRIYLESNSKLMEALRLYQAAGFQHIPPRYDTAYARVDVFMELSLESSDG